jgi:ketosteroid isomerase-like protein
LPSAASTALPQARYWAGDVAVERGGRAAGFDAFNRGDLEGILADLTPGFEFHPSCRFMDTQQAYMGRQGFADFWDTFQGAWEDITISIERIEDLDDRVLTLGTFHGTGGGSGVEVHAESAWLHTMKDGLIVHLRSFATWKEAIEAVGLSE